jgi:hypothetical protein
MKKGSTQIAAKTNVATPEKLDVKTQLIQIWKFHEITVRTPKDGFLMSVADKEVGMINLLVANYTFNKDGSITLDPRYIEKQGVKEARWKLNDSGNLVISYFWSPEKQKEAGFTNSYEEMEYKIDVISDKELSLNMSDMFIVNLVTKTKK